MSAVELCLSDNEDNPQRWYFRVKAANGEIVAQSESYTTKHSAEMGIRALRRALIPNSAADQALNARAWQRGYLFAHYQDVGYGAEEADLKSRREDPPADLQEHMDACNPYKCGGA